MRILKIIWPVALSMGLSPSLSAQFSQSPEVLANCGGTGDTLGYKMEWTLGELAIESLGNSLFHLTQGFHQPNVGVSTVGITEHETAIASSIWPNPTQDELTISFGSPLHDEVMVNIVGLDGRTVSSRTLKAGIVKTSLSVTDLAPGGYLVVLVPADASRPTVHRFIKMSL